MDLNGLMEALEDAQRAEGGLSSERSSKRRRLLGAEEKRIDHEMEAEYGDRIRALALARGDAEKALTAATEAAALAGTDRYGKPAKFPLGSIVSEWGISGTRWDKERKPIKTGRRAVYEAVTRDSQFGGNTASYSQPKVGDFILRLLRKDGTPGLLFIANSHQMGYFKLDSEAADAD